LIKSNENLREKLYLIGGTSVLATRFLYEKFGLFDEELKWKIDKEMWMRWLCKDVNPSIIYKYIAIWRRHHKSISWISSRVPNISPKKPKIVNAMYNKKVHMRDVSINDHNTLMLHNYDYNKFIDDIL